MTYFVAPTPYRMARRWARMAGYDEPARDFTLAVDVRDEDDAYVISAQGNFMQVEVRPAK